MGRFEDFKQNKNIGGFGSAPLEANPTVQYELQEPVERMVEAWEAVDAQVQVFLERIADDEMFAGILDVHEEWRCWVTADKKNSCLLFDESLEVLHDKAYEHFIAQYGAEWKDIRSQVDEIGKMGKSLDEYKLFKAALYNVFNNKNRLPIRQYFDQVYSRANEYNMVLERHSKHDMDLMVTFRPLDDVNRGNPYLNYTLRMAYNPSHGMDGFVYSAKTMDAQSAENMYSGPVDLPVLGQYEKFEERVNDHFLNAVPSLFHFDAVRDTRMAEKAKYNIPAYYFEATFIDVEKLNNFSKKSYQYGHSSVFIPKSQVAFGGDKLYVNKWLYYKLKDEILSLDSRLNAQKDEQNDLLPVNDIISDASARAGEKVTGKDKEMELG